MLNRALQDIRYAARGFTQVADLWGGRTCHTCSGIGANGAIFTVVNTLLLERRPDRGVARGVR